MKPRVMVIIALSVIVVGTIITYQAVSSSKTTSTPPTPPQSCQPSIYGGTQDYSSSGACITSNSTQTD